MKEIDEKILRYCGIYQQPEISEAKKKEILKMKKELEKRTGMKIEKIYVYGKSYWGKDVEEDKFAKEICFLVDERIKRLDEEHHVVREYVREKWDTTMLVWSLCQFEKRRQSISEQDHYIANYGALIYDSSKQPEVNERIYSTEYAARVSNMKYTKKYFSHDEDRVLMRKMLEIYLLKIGYYAPEAELSFRELTDYISYVSEDKKVLKIIEEYQKQTTDEIRDEVYRKFEKYVNGIKQVTMQFKLPEEPTMQIYERNLERLKKEGPLDINKLTKDELYIMYVLQQKDSFEIAKLYGVDSSKITQKNNYWKIRVKEEIITPENIRDMNTKLNEENIIDLYKAEKKTGILSFEKCIDDILTFMRTAEIYLLKEFWRFTEYERGELEEDVLGKNVNSWYRATLAMEFLKDNDLVEEVEFKKYRITKLGRTLVQDSLRGKIDFVYLIKRLKVVDLFGMILTRQELLQIQELENEEDIPVYEINNEIEEQSKQDNEEYKQDILLEQQEETKKIENDIHELNIFEEKKFDCKCKKYEPVQRKSTTTKRTKKQETLQKNRIEISDNIKSNLGIKGERYIYEMLLNKNRGILNLLEIEDFDSLVFYNIDYNFETNDEDKSIGHGCDIEVHLKNGEVIYLEVKTSYGKTNFYTMTANEYKLNLEKQNQFYLIKIENFKFLNKDEQKLEVTVIQNPCKCFEENKQLLYNISFYTNN